MCCFNPNAFYPRYLELPSSALESGVTMLNISDPVCNMNFDKTVNFTVELFDELQFETLFDNVRKHINI